MGAHVLSRTHEDAFEWFLQHGKHMTLWELFKQLGTVEELEQVMEAQDIKGRAKYGISVDAYKPDAATARRMALEELADMLVYLRVLEGINKIEH